MLGEFGHGSHVHDVFFDVGPIAVPEVFVLTGEPLRVTWIGGVGHELEDRGVLIELGGLVGMLDGWVGAAIE